MEVGDVLGEVDVDECALAGERLGASGSGNPPVSAGGAARSSRRRRDRSARRSARAREDVEEVPADELRVLERDLRGRSGCGIPPATSIAYRLRCPERFETKTSDSPTSCGSTWSRAESSDSIRRALSPPAVSTTERATGLGGYRLEHRFGDVEVRVDVLDVVRLLEPLDEAKHLARGRLVAMATVVFGTIASSADSAWKPAASSASGPGQGLGRARDLERRAVERDVVGARVRRREQELLLVRALGRHEHEPAPLELPGDGPVAPRFPPCFENRCRTSEAVRLRLSVSASTSTATPSGP